MTIVEAPLSDQYSRLHPLYYNVQHQRRGDVLNIKHGVDHLTGGGLTACNKDWRTKKLRRDFSQEMQGRRVDEALLRDFGEIRLDE